MKIFKIIVESAIVNHSIGNYILKNFKTEHLFNKNDMWEDMTYYLILKKTPLCITLIEIYIKNSQKALSNRFLFFRILIRVCLERTKPSTELLDIFIRPMSWFRGVCVTENLISSFKKDRKRLRNKVVQ